MTEGAETQDTALSSVVDRVTQKKERVRIKVLGQEVAVVPVEDLEFIEDVEDRLDLMQALESIQEAQREGGVMRWKDFLEDLRQGR